MTACRNPVNCPECGTRHDSCPECEGSHVTPLEPPAELHISTSVSEFVQNAEDEDSATFTNVCWDCGWSEGRTITVTLSGDSADE